MTISAYPLTWPETMPRSKSAAKSQFRTTLNGALANVKDSLKRFASDSNRDIGTSLVISSNVTLGVTKPTDPGVAVWFVWDGMQVCIAVDRYPNVEDNLQAIHHVIEARRTELRHGGLAIVRATFQGFRALPSPSGKRHWREVFKVKPEEEVTAAYIETFFRTSARTAHPDKGGTDAEMAELNAARAEALKEIGAS